MRFHDRSQAGRNLADWFLEWPETGRLTDIVVLALPRGGVPVAAELARALNAPLDIQMVRKIGMPGRPELAVGAVVDDQPPVFEREKLEVLGLTEEELMPLADRERKDIRRRERRYRTGRPAPHLRGRSVILVDDGLATGTTARAALRHLREQHPRRLILAVPVGSPDVALELRDYADSVVCLHMPEHFRAISQWYAHFDEVGDTEIVDILRSFYATA
ncbi:phosphoribosyltransferase [Streptomyces sulfonofaciens]|uniref:Phosphoribosyltransferase n=1 Tax=Streptomyces sulfonofaciens TaxID=68272 RepID=A0A919FWV1_9ACTN|nr:phosphoribosyltransferase family protein [Streptomyces sulfonofaciens]GHH73369.1 phosphoribosyltransferase [Streptomyces sulfonofaciens]